jgi:hypothetical protein
MNHLKTRLIPLACVALFAWAPAWAKPPSVPACERGHIKNPRALHTTGCDKPDNLVATWFGVTNHHYQIGDVSFVQDGQVSNYVGGTMDAQAAVNLVWDALAKGGATPPTHIFIGHDHTADHSRDIPQWINRFPEVKVYAPLSTCSRLANQGIPNECTALTPDKADGRYTIELGEHVQVRPVRWRHSNHSGCVTNVNTTPTYGFLISANTKSGLVTVYSNDSGSGTPDLLTTPVMDLETGTYLPPMEALGNAMQGAGAPYMDLWQGGSETRVIRQARHVVPAFKPKAYQPQHWAERNLLEGIPYYFFPGPTFAQYLADNNVDMLMQENYLDAVVVDTASTRRHPNPEVKAHLGLPANGPGPGPVGPHPRLVTVPSGECLGD